MLVFGRSTAIDEIAGHHRDIRERVEPVDLSDRPRQELCGVDTAVEQFSHRDDMRVR
jgi:hypothetical protein